MTHAVCISIDSRDHPLRVDSDGRGAVEEKAWAPSGYCASARRIERGEGTVAGPQEAVTNDGVTVESRDRPRRVDAGGEGALEKVCASARGIECGEGAVASPQEAVKREVCVVSVVSPRSPPPG
jgi:hypothetical protein